MFMLSFLVPADGVGVDGSFHGYGYGMWNSRGKATHTDTLITVFLTHDSMSTALLSLSTLTLVVCGLE